MTRAPRRQRGFTLLEAIVAMVLISGAGMALFSWINSNLTALTRIHEVNTRSEATTNILQYMDTVNPMLDPEGRAALGAYAIHWQAQPSTNITEGANFSGARSLYQFALYRTAIFVTRPGKGAWFALELQQVGYKRVRNYPALGG